MQIGRWLLEHHETMIIPEDLATAIGLLEYSEPWEMISSMPPDFIIVLGGDGTLLRAAKQCADLDCPILGINLGHLGFMTEVEVPEIGPALAAVTSKEYELDVRHLLRAEIWRQETLLDSFTALNDVVVTKGPHARLINVETYVNNAYVNTYPADGIIIATPTGSTAYSFSAGGPILSPDLNVMVLTPICPHSFFDRSIVINAEQKITLRLRTSYPDALVTIDGQEVYPLEDGDEVVVMIGAQNVSLIRRPGWNFFQVLRGWRKGH